RISISKHEHIRDWFEPRSFRARIEVRGDWLTSRAEIHRAGTAFATAHHVETDVGGDAVQPRPQRRPTLEAVESTPGADEHVLDGVFGVEGRGQHSIAVRAQL